MSYDNIISRSGAQAAMKQTVAGKKPLGPSGKGLAGPAKTQGKPAPHKSTKHK